MYIGVDYSTRKVSAAALYGGRRLGPSFSFARKPNKAKDYDADLTEIVARFESWLAGTVGTGWATVAIEAPLVGGNLNRQIGVRMGMVAGAIYAMCLAHECGSVYSIPPAKWKKEVLGAGNLNKSGIWTRLNEIDHRIGRECADDDDLADAYCLALHASGYKWDRKVE